MSGTSRIPMKAEEAPCARGGDQGPSGLRRGIAVPLILFFAGALPLLGQRRPAVIREMSGTVELLAPGEGEWRSAVTGEPIAEGTIISTGFKSSAVLEAGNATILIRALTRLSLEEILSRDNIESINIGLRAGRIRAEVNPPAGGGTGFAVFEMGGDAENSGGVISGNAAANNGGGVYVVRTSSSAPGGFTKTSGIINGNDAGSSEKNTAAAQGQAAFYREGTINKYRNTTLGSNDGINTGSAGGWAP